MLDVDTYLTTLYVMVDDFCQSRPQKQHPGPEASLSPSEVVTPSPSSLDGHASAAKETSTAIYASTRLSEAFPSLPDRSQFNRLVPHTVGLIEEVALHLAQMMETRRRPYQALDSSAIPVRDAKRRGEGWLAGRADIGWSNSLGWYEGFRLLVAVDPTGVVMGFGFCAASAAEQEVAETFFATRHRPNPRLPSVGSAFYSGPYVADKGFEGEENHRRWLQCAMEYASSIRPSATAPSDAGPSP